MIQVINSLWVFCFAVFKKNKLLNDGYKMLKSIAGVDIKITDDYTWNSSDKQV